MAWRIHFMLAVLMIVFAFAHILALQKLNAMQSERPAAFLDVHFFFFNDTATTEIYTLSLHDAAPVDNRHRHEQRQLRRYLLHRRDRGLAVERVEDGLDEEEVDPALAQRASSLRVAVFELIERNVAIGRVVDAGRKRERDVGRAKRAGDEAVLEL